MKHLITAAVITLFLFSCKKELNPMINSGVSNNFLFLKNVLAQLKDSLPAPNYANIDTAQLFKSKDVQSKCYFVRIAFENKKIANDFILLKTDSSGKIREGKIIHVDKSAAKRSTNNVAFQGQFVISSLSRTQTVSKAIVNGKWQKQSNTTSLLEEQPAGEQTLPDVVDANSTYKITLYADIPVNGDPSQLFDVATGSVGHSFIQLIKSNAGQSIQQNIGFYPSTGWKSLSTYTVSSKMVDNAGHEFNASLSTSLNATEFQSAMNEIHLDAQRGYNIATWNCTNFAVDVFDIVTQQSLTIPQFMIPGSYTNASTPQALFDTIKGFQNIGNNSFGTTEVPGVCSYVGGSHGSCGN